MSRSNLQNQIKDLREQTSGEFQKVHQKIKESDEAFQEFQQETQRKFWRMTRNLIRCGPEMQVAGELMR